MSRLTTRLFAGTAVVATALTLAAGQAMADPPFAAGNNDVVGVGSDTTEIVLNNVADNFNVGRVSTDIRLASFDATGSANIQISPTKSIPRPNGSSAGIRALLDPANPQIDFARSSRAKNTSTDGTLDFYVFASDVQRYATATTSNVPDGLTAAQLREIYTCSAAAVPGLDPKIPQTGSGSRAFFLTSIGLTEDDISSRPGCVDAVQENDPAAVAGNPAALVPFSVGRFGAGQAGIKLNTTGYAPARDLYNVVRDGALTTSTTLRSIFGTVNQGGFICNNPDLIADAGFVSVGARCGTLAFG